MMSAAQATELKPRVLCVDDAIAVYRSTSLGKSIAGGIALWGWIALSQMPAMLTQHPAYFPVALGYVLGAIALPFIYMSRSRATKIALGLMSLLGAVLYIAADLVLSWRSESNLGGFSNGLSFALMLPTALFVFSFLSPALAHPIDSQIGQDGNLTDGLARRVEHLLGIWPGYRRTPAQAALTTILGHTSRLVNYLSILALSIGLSTIVALILTYYRLQRSSPEEELGRWWFLIEAISAWPASLLPSMLIFIAGNWLATGLRILARQFARQAQETLAESDTRAPIVFLRSFSNDRGAIASNRWFPLKLALGEFGRRKIDHMLVEEFSEYGPTFAIGNPAERDTNPRPFGAARKFVADGDWRAQVEAWAQSAVALVIVSGEGSGVRWEIELARNQFPEKALLLFADPQEKRDGKPLIGSYFSGDGEIIELTSSRVNGDSVLMAMRAFFRRQPLSKGHIAGE